MFTLEGKDIVRSIKVDIAIKCLSQVVITRETANIALMDCKNTRKLAKDKLNNF
jgi:hypothetical protein